MIQLTNLNLTRQLRALGPFNSCISTSAFTCIILIIILLTPAFAQQRNKEQLLLTIQDQKASDTTRFLAMAELAYTYWTTKPDSSFVLAHQAIQQSKSVNYTLGIGRGYHVLGVLYVNLGNNAKGLAYYDTALVFSSKASDQKGIGRIYNSLGQLYANFGDYQKALRYHFQSLKIKEAQSDVLGLGNSYNNIGNIYYRLGSYDKALEFCFKSLSLRDSIHDPQGIAASQNNIALIYEKQGSTEKAVSYFAQALSYFKQTNNLRGVTYSCHDMAKLYLNKKEYPLAFGYIQEGLAAAEAMKSKERISDMGVLLSQYYNAIGEYGKATTHAKMALQLAHEAGLLEYEQTAYFELALAASGSNHFQEAYEYQLRFSELSDSIKSGRIVELALQEEFNFREERTKLEQEKKDLIYENEAERQQWVLYITLGVLLAVVIFTYILFRNWKIKQKTSEVLSLQRNELAQKNALIVQQNNLLLDGTLHLEQKIEQRTHDLKVANEELIQKNQALEQFSFMTAHNLRGPVARLMGLSALYNFENLLEPFNIEVMRRIKQSSADLDEVIRDMTAILQVQIGNETSFEPLNVKEVLGTILYQLRQSIADAHTEIKDKLPVDLFVKGTLPFLQSVFYNVISNSIKYCRDARTPLIHISAITRDQEVIITLKDNGAGFDVEGNRAKLFRPFTRFSSAVDGKGLGLYLIKIQMESMHGRVEIQSKVNEGTSVILTFPILV